ncbi:hypothetical protein [Nonomuraea endophytica]|uniref:Spermidine/putrescine-binding protein n=1 Tax=Nonomuraea endophytica TaxID=714136 RepID=A0A7W8AEL5_9ACTN|nr:hypothetical protein [Nonomuraea endophytica]MBB5084705.1 spermidine/putrescine-binding protein [Nonomuraea endophytica]
MNQTRKMWASAAAVGVILVGGATVAAAASAGRVDQARGETRAEVEKTTPTPTPTDGIVVSHDINPDPSKVLEHWTEERMEGAEPMPMPEVELKPGEFELAE